MDSLTGQLSSPPFCPLSHPTFVMPHPEFLLLASFATPLWSAAVTSGKKEDTRTKEEISFSPVLLPTSRSVLPAPPPHAILSLFPPLLCLTCWFTPPPSLLLFPFSGWCVPWTKSMDGQREREKKEKEQRRRGQGVHLQESGCISFHMCSRLCAQWHFKSAILQIKRVKGFQESHLEAHSLMLANAENSTKRL